MNRSRQIVAWALGATLLLLNHARANAGSEDRPIAMVGDSILANANWPQLTGCKTIENFAVPNATAHDMLSLVDNVKRENPASVFLMVGINDLSSRRSAQETAGDILSFARAVKSPTTPVYILRTLPVTATADRTAKVRASVDLLNTVLIASSFKIIPTDGLLDQSGFLQAEFALGDGLHLSSTGLVELSQIMAPAIRKHCPSLRNGE